METTERPDILVLGTLARDTLLVVSDDDPHVFARQEDWVGAPLIREMICQALVELPDDSQRTTEETSNLVKRELEEIRRTVLPAPPDPCRGNLAKHCVQITTVFNQASRTSNPKDRESVLRVEKQYTSPAQGKDLTTSLAAHMKEAVSACLNPHILVLFDFDDFSRQATLPSLTTLAGASGERLCVIGLAGELNKDTLTWLDSLTPAVTGGAERTVAVVRAEELRKAGLIIIESGPIERTVRDLFQYFETPLLGGIARSAAHLVILFEEIGAIYVKLSEPKKGSIYLAPNSDWIAHENSTKYGRTPGRMSITLAAIVRQLAQGGVPGHIPDLSNAVLLSIAAFTRYFHNGYESQRPLRTLESTLSYESREHLRALVDGGARQKPNKGFFLSKLDFPMTRGKVESWTRLDSVLCDDDKKAERLRLIVTHGPEAAFRAEFPVGPGPWYPQGRILCPYMQVGDLKTFDEEEIVGFTSLTKLFRKYLQTPAWKAPLSIAVFGPPGTGKSFAVRELMKSINPASEKELTFNLSQLTSVEALADAFHAVQHRVLSSDEVPLVLFDEFDTTFEGSGLGWLRYFLAPMQDGVFRGRTTDYRTGRAIFVFAGGTCSSFEEFRSSSGDERARASKLPDFVSRLQGFLDIQSINPPDSSSSDSAQRQTQRQIKRALLLRSLLVTHATPVIQKHGDEGITRIDPGLIDAFLNAERYVHGLRSMESLVRMSKWVDEKFIPASLPAKWLLEMHVKGLSLNGTSGPAQLC